MSHRKRGILTCDRLVEEYRIRNVPILEKHKLRFTGVGHKDVYNITAPFIVDREQVLAGRVEDRGNEDAAIYFFRKEGGAWRPHATAPRFRLQDPFFTFIGGELIFGGVEVIPVEDRPDRITWRTVFYRGRHLDGLTPFFAGPIGMKDLRLVELPDGEIGVFTRPQGAKGGRGKIGFAKVGRLEQLSVPFIDEVPLLEDQFSEEEWGGVNEAHILSDGRVGVLGHIAAFDAAGNRHYYPMVFALDPRTGAATDLEIIALRENFEAGPSKRPDLANVVFSGGLVRRTDGCAELYAGVSDAEAHYIVIPDPMAKFE